MIFLKSLDDFEEKYLFYSMKRLLVLNKIYLYSEWDLNPHEP